MRLKRFYSLHISFIFDSLVIAFHFFGFNLENLNFTRRTRFDRRAICSHGVKKTKNIGRFNLEKDPTFKFVRVVSASINN
jgi:hypothetical protein